MRSSKVRKQILSPEQVKAGDSILLSRYENEQRLAEERRRNDDLLKPDGAADVTNAQVQAGRSLSRSELVRRLQKINAGLRYEQSILYPQQGGLYVIENRIDPMTGKPPWKRFICGIPHGQIPEFSTILTKPALAPANSTDAQWAVIQQVDQHIPGWRKILLRLMKEGLLSPSAIDREFQITKGRSSQKWQQATA